MCILRHIINKSAQIVSCMRAWTLEWPARLYVAAEYTAAYISSSVHAPSNAGYIISPIRWGEAHPSACRRNTQAPFALSKRCREQFPPLISACYWNRLCGYEASLSRHLTVSVTSEQDCKQKRTCRVAVHDSSEVCLQAERVVQSLW